MAEARSEMAFQAELYIRKRAEARLLRTAVERYRQQKQGPLLARASALFATLTLGGFSRLIVDYDGDTARLAGVRADAASVVPVEGMSEGTVDQLFLALRIAALEDAVAQGIRLPFVADDHSCGKPMTGCTCGSTMCAVKRTSDQPLPNDQRSWCTFVNPHSLNFFIVHSLAC